MSALIPWFGRAVADRQMAHGLVLALGWTLVHFCWQGVAVAVVLGIVLSAVGMQRSQMRYGASCFALALMVVLPVATFVHLAGVELAQSGAVAHGVLRFDVTAMPNDGGGGAHVALRTLVRKALNRAVPWLPAVWLAGVVLFLARLAFGLSVARRLRANTTEFVETELRAAFRKLTQDLKIRRTVALLHSAMVQVPTVVGWLRPVVLLPVCCFAGLSAQQIEALLAHELAHVRRNDYLVSVAQSVVEALLFYHPAVWWVSQQVRRERECCCDAIAADVCGDRLQYAKALSQLEERRAGVQQIVMAANGGVLTMRIKRLLGYAESPAVSPLAVVALTAALIASVGVYLAGTARAEVRGAVAKGGLIALIETPVSSSAELQPLPAVPAPKLMASLAGDSAAGQAVTPVMVDIAPPTAYGTWLNRDVLWIISPEERAAFLKLSDDAERDQFIESFWQRKERMEGRAGSKDEHYARIAYANEHFGGMQSGWMSDRGHVYIVLGKPESIDAHPAGESSADGVSRFPFEVWNYRHVEGMGDNIGLRFVDACQCGDYKLQLGQGGSFSAGFSPMATRAVSVPSGGGARISAGVMQGELIHQVNPVYPEVAKAAHVQGIVVLRAVIGKTGEIKALQMISGPPMLAGSAMDAVRQWKYKPYVLNGEPTEVETTINVNFSFAESTPQTMPGGADTPVSTIEGGHAEDMAAASADRSAETFAARPVRMADGATRPVVLSTVDPEFTVEARKAKMSGVVTVGLTVDESGLPKNVHVVRRVGFGLDEKAVEAVHQYRFKPAMKDGKPVEESLNVEVNFRIF
jgi:TonB family protein